MLDSWGGGVGKSFGFRNIVKTVHRCTKLFVGWMETYTVALPCGLHILIFN